MKYLIILFLLVGCSTKSVRKQPVTGKIRSFKPYRTNKAKHFKCVIGLIRIDVVPLDANSICVSIFRKTF